MKRTLLAILVSAACAACGGGEDRPSGTPPGQGAAERPVWALAVHAGAGVISKSVDEKNRREYLDSLRLALEIGRRLLADGGSGLDAVEQILVFIENDPKFNAGKGAVYNHDGAHELDASIMDGRNLACGAVAGVGTVKNPIVLARRVMEDARHVLLAGPGAERFAEEIGLERVTQEYFHTEKRRRQWQERLKESGRAAPAPRDTGTAGVVALDRHGNLAAGTSTGGITDKRFGRVGDSPIIGAGTYANNATCAISSTGKGEEFIRHGVAQRISDLMEYRGLALEEAAREVVLHLLQPGDGGVIGVDRAGNITMVYNTEGMFRAAADSSGRLEVAIWE